MVLRFSLLVALITFFVSCQQRCVSCTKSTSSQLRSVPSSSSEEESHHQSLQYHGRNSNNVATRRSSRRTQASLIKVKQFYLVDTITGNYIKQLVDGDSYDVATLTTTNITIRALVAKGAATNCFVLHFDLDNGQLTRDTSNAPYTLVGNVVENNPKSGYAPTAMLKQVGPHVLLVTPNDCPPDSTEVFTTEPDLVGTVPQPGAALPADAAATDPTVVLDGLDVVSDSIYDDGSLQISFTVYNGNEPLPPTPAPVPVTDVVGLPSSANGTISGNLRIWNTISISFNGPLVSEMSSSVRGPYGPLNTFKDYKCDVTITYVNTSETFVRPCYFNLDGNAANSYNKPIDGAVWTVNFVPKYIGIYTYQASFRQGTNCAPNGGGDTGGYFDGSVGAFEIIANTAQDNVDMSNSDLRRKGKLQYVGKSLLQFVGTKEFFIASGPDSPDNLLAYNDFDDTSNNGNYLKSYASHVADFNSYSGASSANTWSNGKGEGIMGAMNYLASKGMNSISINTLTIDGIDRNVFPFSLPTDGSEINPNCYDTSKLSQWNVLFDWLSKIGIVARVKLSDSFSDAYFTNIEDRRLYYREMIARFGHHLGIIWDLGEDITNVDEIKTNAAYIKSIDPYSPIMVQTMEQYQSSVYGALLGGDVDCISIVSTDITQIGPLIAQWATKSSQAGKPYVITNDKQGTTATGIVADGVDRVRTSVRQNVIWNTIMYGGAGSRYYFGSTDDVTLQDFRTRDSLFSQASLALQFFQNNSIPLADMKSSILSITQTTSKFPMLQTGDGQVTVVYKGYGSSPTLSVPLNGQSSAIYSLKWYSPTQGKYVAGSSSLKPGTSVSLGNYPAPSTFDWVALIQCTSNCGSAASTPNVQILG